MNFFLIKNIALWADNNSYESVKTLSWGTVYAKAVAESCAPTDTFCQFTLTVTAIQSKCLLDRSLSVQYTLTGGLEPIVVENSYRVISDLCPVQLSGKVTPGSRITL